MINSSVRLALLSSVSTAMVAFLLPGTAAAQATNCANVSTTANNSPAVVVAANGTTNITCGTVTTTGAASDAILVSNTAGTTTMTGGTTSATGAGSRGIVVTSSAPAAADLVTVNTGTVTANGNAVVASATSGPSVLVNANANITSSAGAGITVTTTGGAATVGQIAGSTITGATDAIRVNNTVGGAINVNALGTLVANNGSGVFVGTNAASADAINVTTNIVRSTGGPGTWGSQVRASAGTGDITITSNGVMSSAGAPGSMFGGILAATTGTSNRNVTINVNADIGSPTDRSPAAQVLVNGTSTSAKTLAVNIANASIFGLPAAVQVSQNATSLGDIRIIGTGTGTLSATGPTGIGINARILNAANPGNILVDVTQNVFGTVQGINATTIGTGTVTVAARGNVTATTGAGITAATLGTTLVTIGAGTTTTGVQGVNLQGTAGNTLIVNGTLRNIGGSTPYTVLAGGPFTLTLGAAGTIVGPLAFTTGNDTFNNQGTFAAPTLLDFGAGVDVFNNSGTLTAFTGTSTIGNLETFNNVGGLIDMRDGAANDVLAISGNFVGSGASRLGIDFNDTTSDRLVINAASGTTTVNATNLGAGLLNVPGVLVVDNATSSPGAFVLGTVGGNTSPLVDYRLAQVGADYFLVAAPNASAFDPLAIITLAPSLWYQSADEVFAQADQPAMTVGASFWGQGYYSRDKFGDNNDSVLIGGTSFGVNNRVETKRMGIQAGVDYGFGGARVGLTGGYGRAKADNDLSNDLKATGWNVGLYGQFGGLTGFHGAGLIKYDRYKLRFNRGAFDDEGSRLTALGIDGSLGYRFGIGTAATLDAKVGVSRVRNKIDDVNAFGFNYDIDRITSTRGRAGVRATFGGRFAPYVDATVYREFSGRRNVALFDGLKTYDLGMTNGKGTWARLEAGISSNGGPGPLVAAWADVGDKKGFGLRAGFRFGGAALAGS
ncbi:MAG: hypothetical protein LH610_01025 [Sphingomonas bacterium]|nr:hypothetical protein [Sphingomonas bacterium]